MEWICACLKHRFVTKYVRTAIAYDKKGQAISFLPYVHVYSSIDDKLVLVESYLHKDEYTCISRFLRENPCSG